MAKYYKEISELLKLGAESFEDELKQIVSYYFSFSLLFDFFFLPKYLKLRFKFFCSVF